ncbi:MAG TPA: PEP/pyruvate-binding domain-containing protein, partial [Nakamurella multipartita]|nr:PEP/pyruvate-binding domain-containing protein [Nakamurella multipartita]
MTTTTSVVLDLSDLSGARLADVGGKAANLGDLLAAGFRVPDGFCVTTAAYRSATAGRLPALHPADGGADGGPVRPAALRAAVLAAPMPRAVADAVR